MMLRKSTLVVGGCLALLLSTCVGAEELAKIRILALSPADARVVLQDEAGQVRILAPGDSLLRGEFRVRQVLIDRLVLVDTADDKLNEMTWLFKPRSAEATPRVQRFSGKPEDETEVLDVIESSSEMGRSNPAGQAD